MQKFSIKSEDTRTAKFFIFQYKIKKYTKNKLFLEHLVQRFDYKKFIKLHQV